MHITINSNDIMMSLGYKDTSANEFVIQQADVVAKKANCLSSPCMVYKKIKINQVVDDQVILESGDIFKCYSLAKDLKGCSHIIVAIYTIGNSIDESIDNAFKADDFLLGMMLDAAGSRLVAYYANCMWREFASDLDKEVGITKGYAPGSLDFPIEQQSVVFNILNAEDIDVYLSKSMLMKPAKSISAVYGIGQGVKNSCEAHSCSGCPRKDCMMRDDRQVVIKIHINDEIREVKSSIGKALGEVFKDNDIPMDFPCNQKGTCGGCAARFVKIIPKITQEDTFKLSNNKIDEGWRLVCKVVIEHPLELYINQDEMQILSEEKSISKEVLRYMIAIDIGTTTIVCHLIDADSGSVVDTQALVNKQRIYGADVASRILHEMNEKDGKINLNQSIINQLNEMIEKLISKNEGIKVDGVIAVGNTIMTHILLGYNIVGLGQAPYTPYSLNRAKVSCNSLGIALKCDMTIIEGMDSYVGSDISVGAAFCDLMEKQEYSLLIDLGTNGEIALGNSDTLLCCATAAGPAFEAVNIHNGMSGLPGAVSEFCYKDGEFKYKTIGEKPPLGICGSGVLDIIATLIRQGIVDITGRMLIECENVMCDEKVKEYFVVASNGDDEIIFTAKDVRELQLAKAAIAAGVMTLIETAKIRYADIDKVYVAGGFGNYMNLNSALEIGLIPKELADKIVAAGNTAAKGAIACHRKDFLNKVAKYVDKSQHVDLSTSMIFQNNYIESMGFDG